MHECTKFLLFANPTLEKNVDISPFESQVTLQYNPPPEYYASKT